MDAAPGRTTTADVSEIPDLERHGGAEHAVAPDRRYLDRLPLPQSDQHRDCAAVRQVNTREWVACLSQDSFPDQFDGFEPRAQRLELRRRQRLQQMIGWTLV